MNRARNFRQQDLPKPFAGAGFAEKSYVEIRVPNYGAWPGALFEVCGRGEAVPSER
ncbi:MAG: hypothetical protein O3C65_13190 [Proteobacteria bacterium]|nr:hypothetical protein [Pseudomonadota bacterium]MDA1059631.1 hypothetical protein [Pseudomonadota bacterium]